MRSLFFLSCLLTSQIVIAQSLDIANNSVQITFASMFNYSTPAKTISTSVPLVLAIQGWDTLPGKKVHLQCSELNLKQDFIYPANDPLTLAIQPYFKDTTHTAIHIEIQLYKKDAKTLGNPIFSLNIYSDGHVTSQLSSGGATIATSLPPAPSFLETSFSKGQDLSGVISGKTANICYPQVVVYFPCCNKYVVYFKAGDKYDTYQSLRFHSNDADNTGVTFIVANYNTLKYTASLTNTFVNNFTNIPSLWTTVTSPGGGLSNTLAQYNVRGNDQIIQVELQKLSKVIMDLKKFILADCAACGAPADPGCSDFQAERSTILTNIASQFNDASGHPTTNVYDEYTDMKRQYLQAEQVTSDSFNVYFAKRYLVTVTPDSLASNAQNLINTVAATTFYSLFHIPQMQNADKLIFTLNLQASAGMNGSLNVISQPISVPIRGGWKLDWSSGFYWGSVKNENYALVPNSTGIPTLIKENHFANGGTVGIAALLHAYPRTGGRFNVGASLGVGKSLDVNYSILLGPSFLFGRDNRLSITGGWNLSSIKALSASETALVNTQLPTGTAISTYNRLQGGIFFSFTYAFGITSSSQTASASPGTGSSAAGAATSASGASGASAAPAATSSPGTTGKPQ